MFSAVGENHCLLGPVNKPLGKHLALVRSAPPHTFSMLGVSVSVLGRGQLLCIGGSRLLEREASSVSVHHSGWKVDWGVFHGGTTKGYPRKVQPGQEVGKFTSYWSRNHEAGASIQGKFPPFTRLSVPWQQTHLQTIAWQTSRVLRILVSNHLKQDQNSNQGLFGGPSFCPFTTLMRQMRETSDRDLKALAVILCGSADHSCGPFIMKNKEINSEIGEEESCIAQWEGTVVPSSIHHFHSFLQSCILSMRFCLWFCLARILMKHRIYVNNWVHWNSLTFQLTIHQFFLTFMLGQQILFLSCRTH